MHTLHILVPANGDPTIHFDPRKYRRKHPYNLTALVYRKVLVSLTETDQNRNTRNPTASKLFSYLLNPCLIYVDREIFGDTILSVSSEEKMTKDQIFTLLDETCDRKDTKEIPDDLRTWCKSRIRMLAEKREQMVKEGKEVKDLDAMRTHVKKSKKNYGMRVVYASGSY